MIIKQQGKPKTKKNNTSSKVSKGNIIKKEEVVLSTQIVDKKNNDKQEENKPKLSEAETFEKIDISSIQFQERIERRRGDRRKGYRRIDERSLVSRAQQEAYSIKELAAREGYQSGLTKAKEEIEELKNSIVEFLALKNQMYEDFYPHLIEIALVAAKKIIKKEVELSDDILKNVVSEAVGELNSDVERVTIKVNPEDIEFAEASLPEMIAEQGLVVKTIIQEDETIEKGSAVVIANNGVIDANFKTQLLVLQNAFGIYQGGI